MSFEGAKLIWHNGRMIPWEQATVHVMAHALHYGSSVFEGIRVYKTPNGPKVFRLTDHMQRLFESALIHRISIPFDLPTLIGAWEWGAYLGADGLEKGVDVCVSSWNRVAPNTIPALAKAGGNYLSSTLISGEAKRLGFAEGIALAPDGLVSEGAGENLFVIRDGKIFTPSSASSILTGITRDTVLQLARRLGIEICEQSIPREMLYLADEMFFTGTAAEITPIRSVDRIEIGEGHRGPLTKQLQDAFFGLFNGETEDRNGWLEGLDAQPVAAAGGS